MDEQAAEKELKALERLKKIDKSEEFKDYFDFLLETVTYKMLWAFTAGKDGDNIKNWDDFCKVRGEIVARLHPIQEVRSSEAITAQMKQQIKSVYNQNA